MITDGLSIPPMTLMQRIQRSVNSVAQRKATTCQVPRQLPPVPDRQDIPSGFGVGYHPEKLASVP